MEISEFSKGSAWAILPETFDQLINRYWDIKIDVTEEQKTAALVNGEGSDGELYIVDDGIAIVPIVGPLFKRPTFFSRIFGGSSYQEIGMAIKKAVSDSQVGAIVLSIDSPGGVVNGTEALSDLIFNLRNEKPIISYVDGSMTSAAYWIGSAAETVVAGPTSVLGSIGVLMIHRDYSEMEKSRGVKTSYITAGKYKALGNPSEPLTLEAKEYFQNQLDYIYSIFVDSVARNRDMETDKVLSDMAEGRLFIGQQAVDVGLADQVGSFTNAIGLARLMVDDTNIFIKTEDEKMDITNTDQLAEAFPALVLEVQERATKAAEEKGKQNLTAERERIIELMKIQFGDDQGERFGKLINSDIDPDTFKATKDLIGDRKDQDHDQKEKILAELKDSGADNPGSDGGKVSSEKDYMTICREYQSANKCSLLDAQRAVDKMNPELRIQYIKAVNE